MTHFFEPVSRRMFLKGAAAGGVLFTTLPLWNSLSFKAFASEFQTNPVCDLPRETLFRLLEIALRGGGSFAEVYVEYSVENYISLEEEKIQGAEHGIDMGVGIRVLHGEKTGYAFSDDLDLKKLELTAEVASFIARGGAPGTPTGLTRMQAPSYYTIKVTPDSIVAQEKAKLLWKADSLARGYDTRINQVNVGFNDNTKKIVIANSEGLWIDDIQTMTGLFVSVQALEGDKKSSGYASKYGVMGYEHFTPEAVDAVATDAARMAIAMLPAEDAPAGEFPAVMAKGYCGTFFHEAIGHSLEADAIHDQTSCFWDKKGEMIASDITNLVDDGTLPETRGTINVDDEGTPGHNTPLIEGGRCVGFLFDKRNAGLMGTSSTGNGRRESYQFYPIPRMTNTYLLPGQDDPEEMVRSVQKGVYIARIGGGNVSSTTGRFVFSVPEGYLIEEGRITRPLKGIQLMGSGPEVLKNIVAVGPDLEVLGAGTCGKGGQGKPVSDGNPTLKVSKITIGGSKV